MQNPFVPGLVLFAVCANAFSQAAPSSVPSVAVGGKVVSAEAVFENSLPDVNPFRDFRDRLKAAIETRDLIALQALYQTNGVSTEQLNDELSRWEPMLQSDAMSRVSIQAEGCFFRDFSRSNKMWKKLAERLTTHEGTHLVQLPTTAGTWILPLVEVEGRLLILPSDKSKDIRLRREDAQPDGPANGSQPIRSETNSTSAAAGSGR
jgi:hypothetical protein